MSNEEVKRTNVLIDPKKNPLSFTSSNELSTLKYDHLHHINYSLYYDVFDERYSQSNILLFQDVRNTYGSNSQEVENLMRNYLSSNSRLALTGNEQRPFTLDQ
jgi:hypothetical protein